MAVVDPKKKLKIRPPRPQYDGSGINPSPGGATNLTTTDAQIASRDQRGGLMRATGQPIVPAEADTGVASRITELLSQDSPLMQQAETQAKQGMNRRGLLNSSMTVQAAQAGRINAALPIASQEAGQAHQTNLQGRDIQSRERMQGRDITSREGMLGRDIESREGMQELDLETRERIAGLDRDAQDRIANLNVAASERQAASNLAASFENSYSQVISNIMANPDIPAAERQRYLDHAARVRDSNLALVEQLYSIELDWQASGAPTPRPDARPGGPAFPPGGPRIRPGMPGSRGRAF